MTAWTLKKLPSLGENLIEKVLPKRARNGCAEAARCRSRRSGRRGAAVPSGGCCERCDAAEPSAPTFGHRWHRRSRRSRNVAAISGSRFTSRSIDLRQREQTISSHSSCSACMPNASEWSSYMLVRSSEWYAPSPNDFWLHCTMVGWRILTHDGMERCGHNRVWVADVRRAMAPSGAGPVHGSYK